MGIETPPVDTEVQMSTESLPKRESTTQLSENEKLLEFINSSQFSLYDCIELICTYSNNVGIHYYLCQKLLSFPHSELQFYIPQLVQVLLTIETESMALEDLILKLKNENPHFALLTFWQLQALLADLSLDPESYGFQVARRVLNELQSSLFNINSIEDEKKIQKIHENVAPALVLASMMMSCMASPEMASMAKPMVESQGRRQKAYVFKLAKSAMRDFTKNITLKNTKLNKQTFYRSSSKGKKRDVNTISLPDTPVDIVDAVTTKEDTNFRKPRKKDEEREHSLNFDIIDDVGEQMFSEKISGSIKLPKRKTKFVDNSYVHKVYGNKTVSEHEHHELELDDNTIVVGSSVVNDEEHLVDSPESQRKKTGLEALKAKDQYTSSMPNLHKVDIPRSSASYGSPERKAPKFIRSNSQPPTENTLARRGTLTRNPSQLEIDINRIPISKRIKILKANYFRCATQFAIALESISQRLAQVPTEARLSALRAELSLINRDLPAEVDIPTLLPPNKKGRLHKLVTITASEAQVLNSAEKVPYLLLIEYLRDEFDFDPTTDDNIMVLKKSNCSKSTPLFDLNYLSKKRDRETGMFSLADSTDALVGDEELSDGILRSSSNPLQHTSSLPEVQHREMDLGDLSMVRVKNQTDAEAYRSSIVLKAASNVPVIPDDTQDRSPDLAFAQNMDEVIDKRSADSKEFHRETDDLADQMRISALMLAQLDNSPQQLSDSTNQIRAQIIASMKEVQDKFGYRDLEAMHGEAGERKLENDLKTGGIDTSYLGEDWNTRKERIRKTSEYGHLENWDLCSVIAKSGDDLRQEAFACQIIQAMAQIWNKEKSDIWVKKMRILITSATTGLVETITNAVSVHSIKKSLTKKMIEDGELDERGGIASIRDHFIRAFGDPNGFKFRRAQDNFACSLAAYSLICYILRVKDRHNGNIMIDNEGHVIHIDFGFMLSNSPGSVGFEAAPFKFTYEYVDVLGGLQGDAYKKYVRLMQEGFRALRKQANQIVSMCEIMQKDNMQPCFEAGDQTSVQLRQRFHLDVNDDEVDNFVETFLIGKSLGSVYTRLYDQFQLITQGIYS
ncbi:similar to Saccharomyces cerevisiae YNL267W PIK1 Phosphatidylinositol 4-kinase [Maudiozyma barnettii]|uniref:1-phosphatidylinositol 4-kinase n=1 Tax=Maudiozyma barnettii TaxID=61262 RepID=A0A8H2ZHH6_9SACH|nr:1-phosphatidylinositol 4-kinase [Kazachstania barnettii]CAB4253953.1 similar to Saccharomyces cerevisiae YNL267W PIK1 Phosphatidylinositol 4-kinase [Kazachstania barnettii]CAD1781703.1 similar to Saccharomyces cerevisiae YNL267W PIK1 Phosphatidylinositol 4-kinase [Kazachstania barnettii]